MGLTQGGFTRAFILHIALEVFDPRCLNFFQNCLISFSLIFCLVRLKKVQANISGLSGEGRSYWHISCLFIVFVTCRTVCLSH